MSDKFGTYSTGLSSPAVGAFSISPNDAQDLLQVTRAIYVGVSGDISVVMKSGEAVSFIGVGAGAVLPLRVARVNATGTSASNIVGLV